PCPCRLAYGSSRTRPAAAAGPRCAPRADRPAPSRAPRSRPRSLPSRLPRCLPSVLPVVAIARPAAGPRPFGPARRPRRCRRCWRCPTPQPAGDYRPAWRPRACRAEAGPSPGRCAGDRGSPGRPSLRLRQTRTWVSRVLASGGSALASALVHDLGVDDLVVSRRLRRVGRRARLLRLVLLVDGGTHLLADLRGLLSGGLDGLGVVALQ